MTSRDLREQARRAQRLSLTIGSVEDSQKLRDLSKQYDAEADALEKSDVRKTSPRAGT